MVYARLIVNPAAGAGRTARKWPQLKKLLQSTGLHFDYDLTEGPGHAIELARSAVGMGYALVVSVGGDGTINEVVNGLYETGSIKDVTLGIISTGTGSDFIRTIGLPRSYEEAGRRLTGSTRTTVDLGLAFYRNGDSPAQRLFVNFAGVGFAAEVTKATTGRFKALGGIPAYLMGLLTAFLFYHGSMITLSLDGEAEERDIATIVINNGKYGGGSMLLAPDADLLDSLLDVLTVDHLTKIDLLWSLPRIYRGTHLSHPGVSLKKAREIDISGGNSLCLQVDGELLGNTPMAHFKVLPKALGIAI